MSESESDHGVGGFADPTVQEKNKRPWVKPVLTCETATRLTQAKLSNSFEASTLTGGTHNTIGPS
jgi:hypothetical protein